MEINMKVKVAAKINLMLDILGTLPNGYHNLWMIMQSVSLYDTVTVEKVVPPEDYADLQFKVQHLERQADTLARRAAMAEEELEETRDSLLAARQENEELRQTQETPDPLDVIPFREACSALLNRLYSAPFAGDFFKTRTDAELEQYSMSVALIMEWSVKTQDAIENIRNERSGFAGPFDMAI